MTRRLPRAATLTDLLIVLAMLALLAPAVLQFSQGSRETANRVKCGSNLRQIGQAILLYANENKGNYPRTLYQIDAPPSQYTGVWVPNPFQANGPGSNDVTAALFLLIRTQDIDSSPFVCPTTDCISWNFGGKSPQQVSNFPSERHLSYSYVNPYPDTTAFNRGYKINQTLGADFAVAADMNPGQSGGFDPTVPPSESAPPATMQKANTRNHQGAGQNVLFGDGHVDFVQNPFVGVNRDNIYTVCGGGTEPNWLTTGKTISGSPLWSGDSVLLPMATMTPQFVAAATMQRMNRILIGVGIVVLLAIAGVALWLIMRKPPTEGDPYGGRASSPPPLPPR